MSKALADGLTIILGYMIWFHGEFAFHARIPNESASIVGFAADINSLIVCIYTYMYLSLSLYIHINVYVCGHMQRLYVD